MPAHLIDGKAIGAVVRAEIRDRVGGFSARTGIKPCLAAGLVGDDPASRGYVRNKGKACHEAGMLSRQIDLPATLPENDLLALVAELNADPAVHGILVQLPLPGHIDESRVIEAISPDKDVDGFHPVNAGRLLTGGRCFVPCTPLGIMKMLDHESVDLKGKHAVVVGRSNIVGKPVALMLLARHATVTICHSRTAHLKDEVGRADILIVAIGKAGLVRGDWIKPGAVVIDVGSNRLPSGKFVGDVEFESAKERASWISPVPR